MTAPAVTARADMGKVGAPGLSRLAWVIWRQHRMALAGAGILLGLCAVALAVTGLRMRASYAQYVRAGCALKVATVGDRCGDLLGAYYHAGFPLTGNPQLVVAAGIIVPLVIGMFIGAPLLAREYEAGTFRFAWTQAAGRNRWVVAKLALVAAALTGAGAASGALLSWWLAVDNLLSFGSRWQPGQFAVTAVTIAGWMLLAFAAGALAGTLIRRTVPAMAATGVCTAAVALFMYRKVNPWLVGLGPVTRRAALSSVPVYQPGSPQPVFLYGEAQTVSSPPGSWPLRAWLTGPGGRAPSSATVYHMTSMPTALTNDWLIRHHLTLWIAYQPAGRFWLLQSAEGAACLVLALLLGAATVWWAGRRAV